jgi:SAM-dependent methyltransferase
MTAAESYTARIDAVNQQRERLRGKPHGDRWGGATARRFRVDPHRALEPNLAILADYVRPDDVVVDVGGGAGRICLPLALRCREVINVDPSPGMAAEFESLAAETGIKNARFVQSDWLEEEGVEGDVAITANVTYFVRDIERFVEKMEAAARRRVIITVWSVPPPAMDGELFRLVFSEEEHAAPGHRELLPVLWEMGILPDVRVLPASWDDSNVFTQTRDEAIAWAADRVWPDKPERARPTIEARFDRLFAHGPDGFRPLWRPAARELLITWESRGQG